MVTFTEILEKLKGKGNEEKIIAGKASFSASGFGQFVNAAVNDKNYKFKQFDKATGADTKEVSIHDLYAADYKKNLEKHKYPQKSEVGIVDTAELVTDNLPTIIQVLTGAYIETGRKFNVPDKKEYNGSIFLAAVPAKTKVSKVRDMKTGADLGTSTTTSKDCFQIRAKSPIPKHLQTKVRKDLNGNVVK